MTEEKVRPQGVNLTGNVYPAPDLVALPTSSALMSDLLVNFRCTLKGDAIWGV